MAEPLRLAPLGDAALTLTLGDRVDPFLNGRVQAWASLLQEAAWPGLQEVVPGYAAVSLFFDPCVTSYGELADRLQDLAPTVPAAMPEDRAGGEVVIPVRYDGPDLEEVAARTGLSAAEVVARHAGRTYRVYLLGFTPGFAYLGELDPALVLPRRASPRPRVPAGSVAIAGAQTAVYPLATPGGWHLIGHTDLTLFDPQQNPPSRLRPGDRVCFEALP